MDNNIPDFQTIMYPLLKYLGDGEPHPLKQVVESLAAKFNLTEDDLRLLVPSVNKDFLKIELPGPLHI